MAPMTTAGRLALHQAALVLLACALAMTMVVVVAEGYCLYRLSNPVLEPSPLDEETNAD